MHALSSKSLIKFTSIFPALCYENYSCYYSFFAGRYLTLNVLLSVYIKCTTSIYAIIQLKVTKYYAYIAYVLRICDCSVMEPMVKLRVIFAPNKAV